MEMAALVARCADVRADGLCYRTTITAAWMFNYTPAGLCASCTILHSFGAELLGPRGWVPAVAHPAAMWSCAHLQLQMGCRPNRRCSCIRETMLGQHMAVC